MGKITDRLKHAWNAFVFQDQNPAMTSTDLGMSYTSRPDRQRFRYYNEKTIIASIYTRVAIDVASVPIKHVRLDDNNQYQEDMPSALNGCLGVQANIDQSGRQFIQDAVQTLFDEGVIAILPVDTTLNPLLTGGYDVNSMRVGKITNWYPQHVPCKSI